MYVIDVNTSFGRLTEYGYDLSLGALLQALDDHAVACALSCSLEGAHYDARAGNIATLEAARSHSYILPVATLDPREYLGWEGELKRCLKSGFRIFRFYPEFQGWSVSTLLFRRVLERLASSGVCLVFSTAESFGAGWGHAEEIARATDGHGLPVILTDASYGNMAEVISVMQRYPHIFVETNWLATTGAVEIMAAEVSPSRLLYGSSAPLHPMQKALNQVLECNLADEDKVGILGGNALRLLDLSQESLIGRPQVATLDARSFQEPLVDVHSHLGHWRFPIHDEGYDATLMLQRMKRFNISHSIVSSYEGMRYDIQAGNRKLAQAIADHPELRGYVEVNPHQLEASCADMDRYYQLSNFVGVELELSHTQQPTDSTEVQLLMAEIARRGKPVLFTPAGRNLADARAERELALQHPQLAIIHAHSMDASWARTVAEVPNIYVEFCLSKPVHHHVLDCLEILGPERLLFGSDQTLLSLGAAIGLYLDAGLSATQRRLILRENATRIFDL